MGAHACVYGRGRRGRKRESEERERDRGEAKINNRGEKTKVQYGRNLEQPGSKASQRENNETRHGLSDSDEEIIVVLRCSRLHDAKR